MKTKVMLVFVAVIAVVARLVWLRHQLAEDPLPKPGEVWWSYDGDTNTVFAISNNRVLSINEKGGTNDLSKYRYWEFGKLR